MNCRIVQLSMNCMEGVTFEVVKKKEKLNFLSTSYVRGVTLKRTIVIVDECENLNFHELDSIITRIGDHCKILFLW